MDGFIAIIINLTAHINNIEHENSDGMVSLNNLVQVKFHMI